ncbi:MAG: flagellar basal body-associated FliL family protein [Pirellulaceae bacterium]
MADKDQDQAEQQAKPKSSKLMLIIVCVLAVAGGVATPLVVAQVMGPEAEEFASKQEEVDENALDIPEAGDKFTLLDFGEVTANLNENNYNRFIKVSFAMQIAENQKVEIEKILTEREPILRSWLLGHLADKKLDDIKGKLGHNRLRREIHDEFNAVLFDDGIERIQDILFKEINVQ